MHLPQRGIKARLASERRLIQERTKAEQTAARALWRELVGQGAASTVDLELTDVEINALCGLAQTPDEQRVLDKLMALIAREVPSSCL